MHGLHLLAEWYGCSATLAAMRSADELQAVCERLTRQAGLSVVGAYFHQFVPQGATGTLVLAESHIAIHTWPESGMVTLDIFVCNYSGDNGDNGDKAEQLYAELKSLFAPEREQLHRLRRGAKDVA